MRKRISDVIEYPHVVRIKTVLSVSQLEKWFSANCRGEWSIRVEDGPAGTSRRTVAVSFADRDERLAFEAAYKKLLRS